MNLQNAEFIRSAVGPASFLRDGRRQIVFCGKSNVGKSSLINCILRRKNFARVGSAPGKTTMINYFLIDSSAYFVDLPGYGFAKVPKETKNAWGKLMEQYFAEPEALSGGVMIVDARHAPTDDDVLMADLLRRTGCSWLVAANKADKVKKSELEQSLSVIREKLRLDEAVSVLPVSAETGLNCSLLTGRILDMLKQGSSRE